jgi:hypothetical protein
MTDSRSDSEHPLDVFDELLDEWESAEKYVAQDQPSNVPIHVQEREIEAGKKAYRDRMEAALEFYRRISE